jgi:hypothetical protein
MESEREDSELVAAVRQLCKASATTDREVAELRSVVDTLVEIMVGRELLSKSHKRLLDKLRERADSVPGSKVRLRSYVDKHAVANPDIDCQSRLALCHARCCSFSVVLTTQDLEDGEIRWEIAEPYMLRHEEDGYCAHLDRAAGGGCLLYQRRPAACREFDCREDKRVWIDFEKMIPAPMPAGLRPLKPR